jgi:hypothetical protein
MLTFVPATKSKELPEDAENIPVLWIPFVFKFQDA